MTGGVSMLAALVAKRAAAETSVPYGHWYIDGGDSARSPCPTAWRTCPMQRSRRCASGLQRLMQKSYEASVFDPEAFRTRLAQTRPEEIGMSSGGDGVLNRFQLSLLTEGSGTQVFATTFVQWAARETLRRAQPLTLFARFTPRQRENPMNELLSEAQRRPGTGPAGFTGGCRHGRLLHVAQSAAPAGRETGDVSRVVRGPRGSCSDRARF